MSKTRFSNYLRQALSGTSQVKAAVKLGITRSVLNRLMTGERPPTFLQVMKLAVLLDEHPAGLFDLAGDEEAAELCRILMPPADEDPAYELCQRVRVLARRGMSPEVDRALDSMERFWESSRHAFEELAQSTGCQAACLVADHRVQGDVLYRWKVTEEEASRLARLGKGVDWQRYSREGSPISLHLYLLGGKPNRRHIDLCLSNWASSLRITTGKGA